MDGPKFRLVEPVRVNFVDRTRYLRLTMYSLRRAEAKFTELRHRHQSIYKIINETLQGVKDFDMPIDFVSVILWAAALEQEPHLELEDFEQKIVDPLTAVRQVITVVQEAFFGGQTEQEQDDQPSTPAEGDGDQSPLSQKSNGLSSGASQESS